MKLKIIKIASTIICLLFKLYKITIFNTCFQIKYLFLYNFFSINNKSYCAHKLLENRK